MTASYSNRRPRWWWRFIGLLFGHDKYRHGEHIAHKPAFWRRVSVRRRFRLLTAYVRLQWYLLICGMWRGECAFTGWHKGSNQIGYLAATTGSIFDGTIKPVRVFWDEVSASHSCEKSMGTCYQKQFSDTFL